MRDLETALPVFCSHS